MLTPDDIFEKEFKKSMRGYDIDEVNEFLDKVIHDYAKILEENQSLKKENQQLRSQVSRTQVHSQSAVTQAPIQQQPNPISEERKVIDDLLRRVEKLERKTKLLIDPS